MGLGFMNANDFGHDTNVLIRLSLVKASFWNLGISHHQLQRRSVQGIRISFPDVPLDSRSK